jgi:hypothetical protein
MTYIRKMQDNISRTFFQYAKDTELKHADSDKWPIEIAAVPVRPAVTKGSLKEERRKLSDKIGSLQ